MTPPPLSRPVRISGAGPSADLAIRASTDELAALAAANGLESVERFEASLTLRREGAATLHVSGQLEAEVVYRCVVTLEPVAGRVEEPIDVRFRDAPPDGPVGADIGLEAQDPPEPAPGGVADLGAVLAEFFTLGLDPYPRAPGAALPDPEKGEESGGPFAALARLRLGAERS